MAIKQNTAPMGTQSGTVRHTCHGGRIKILLPCCLNLKSARPVSVQLSTLLTTLGTTFQCRNCHRQYEIVFLSTDRYTIQWTDKQD